MWKRRTIIAAALGSAAKQARTQSVTSPLRPSPLRLRRWEDPNKPVLALYIPGREHPAALIEMPEHAWYARNETGQPVWFYKMYGGDPKLQGKVTWSSEADNVSYKMETQSGYTMDCRATLRPDGVAIRFEIRGSFPPGTVRVQAPTCVKLYRPFTDVFLERTYIHRQGRFELIASETPERLNRNAEEWLPCRYVARCDPDERAQPFRVEHQDGVTRYFRSRPADIALIATESDPPGWTAATWAHQCSSVFTNPARTCQHADPEVTASDGVAQFKLRVYLLRGQVQEAWQSALRDGVLSGS